MLFRMSGEVGDRLGISFPNGATGGEQARSGRERPEEGGFEKTRTDCHLRAQAPPTRRVGSVAQIGFTESQSRGPGRLDRRTEQSLSWTQCWSVTPDVVGGLHDPLPSLVCSSHGDRKNLDFSFGRESGPFGEFRRAN